MKKTVMRSYAKLIVRVGANVQKGQEVRVFASLDQPEFIKMLAEECYKAGASRVTVDWNYPELTKLSARYMKLRDLSETREWEKARMQDMVDHLPVRIFIESEDPDGLRGINPKYFKAFAARIKISKPYRDAIDNKHQWCIAAVPGEAWAKKVHPELSKRAAVEQLWKDILYTARADGEDPIAVCTAAQASELIAQLQAALPGAGEGCMARAAVWAAFLRQDPALLAGLPDGLRSRSARLLTDLLAADLNALGETLTYLSARTALTIDYTTAAVAAARGGVQLTEEGMAAVCALLL